MTPEENRRRINQLRACEGHGADGRSRRKKAQTARRPKSGEANPQAKLSADEVRAVRASDASHSALAERYGVSKPTIGQIKRREKWTHIA